MKLLSSHFAVPVVLAAVSFLVGCSSDSTAPANSAGAPAGGSNAAGSAGKAGAGSAGLSAGGAGAGGAGAGGAGAGGGGAGGSAAGSAGAPATAGAGGGAAVDASFATVKAVIMDSCFGNGCHSQEGNRLQMEVDDKLYGTLTTHVTKNCGKLVNTTTPADSALVKVLLGDCGPTPKMTATTTPRMPYQECFDGESWMDNEQCVPGPKVDAIKAWITKGAPQQ